MTVTLAGVGHRYGPRGPWVLDGVDLTLAGGTITVVAGGNGSGKSTLLRVVAGLRVPTRGAVSGPAGSLAFGPDRFEPPVRMSAASYLRHHGRLRGLSRVDADRRAEELAGRFGLAPGLDAALTDLSKGNAQKVALAQAFLAPVDVLVLDEPATALDEAALVSLGELLSEAAAGGSVVLLSDPADRFGHLGGWHGELVHGRLRAITAARADVVTIVLRARPPLGPGARPEDRRTRSCVHHPDGGFTVVVAGSDRDEFLQDVLWSGWSVLEVRSGRAGAT